MPSASRVPRGNVPTRELPQGQWSIPVSSRAWVRPADSGHVHSNPQPWSQLSARQDAFGRQPKSPFIARSARHFVPGSGPFGRGRPPRGSLWHELCLARPERSSFIGFSILRQSIRVGGSVRLRCIRMDVAHRTASVELPHPYVCIEGASSMRIRLMARWLPL